MREKSQDALLSAIPFLCHYAGAHVRRARADPDELRSLVSEAAVSVYKRWDPRRGAFSTFARQAVVAHVRRAWYVGARFADSAASATLMPRSATHASTVVRVRRLLARLTSLERDVVTRHLIGGESLADISTSHGRHRAWACRLLRRAKAKLRAAESDDVHDATSRRQYK